MLRHGQLSTVRRSMGEHPPIDEDAETSHRERSLQMLDQDQMGDNQFVCQSLDVVDACRGMSASYRFRGNFVPYDGPCSRGSKILDGYPIYKTTDTNGIPRYMYAIDVYSDNWSVKELRGLVRWRIVDFEDFKDQTSCRTESANVNQIEFAADGQPYNYWPTIYCFDEGGGELDGYKSSTINIRCNDRSPPAGYNGNGKDVVLGVPGEGREDSKTALVLGIFLIVTAIFFGAFVLYSANKKRKKEQSTKTKKSSGDTEQPTPDLEGMTLTIDSENLPQQPLLPRTPSAPDLGLQEEEEYQDPKRPFSTSSIMTDSMPTDSAGLKPSSMHTVSKPYELLKQRMPRRAPEPPKTPDSSQKRDTLPRKFIPTPTSLTNITNNTNETNVSLPETKKVAENGNNPLSKNLDPPMQQLPQQYAIEKLPNEEDRQPPNDDASEDGSFLSESLSNLFKDIDKSLDEAISDKKDTGHQNTGQNTHQYERIQPPKPTHQYERSEPPKPTHKYERMERPKPEESMSPTAPSSTPSGKNDDMDLSRRSKFAEARGRWSLRGKLFGKEMNDEIKREQRRSKSLDTSGANEFSKRRGRISKDFLGPNAKAQQTTENNNRQPKIEDEHNFQPESNRRSRSKERSGASNYQSKQNANQASRNNGRSRSRERSGAGAFAARKDRRSKSRERSDANAFADRKEERRGRSQERSGASNYGSSKGRSKSLEQSGASGFAQRNTGRRDQSLERTPRAPKTRSHSLDQSKAGNYAAKGSGGEKPKTRSRSFDSSGANRYADRKNSNRNPTQDAANKGSKNPRGNNKNKTAAPSTTITKRSDGTVIVARRRKREDGATVVTKTKYANIKLARKHGVAV